MFRLFFISLFFIFSLNSIAASQEAIPLYADGQQTPCINLNGKYKSLDNGNILIIEQVACLKINIEIFADNGYRLKKIPGLLDGGKCENCSYPQPGCTGFCSPLCYSLGYRKFQIDEEELKIIEASSTSVPEYIYYFQYENKSRNEIQITSEDGSLIGYYIRN